HPTLGRLTTPEYDLLDVQLAKECNMNFIRTSHYPPSETFLDYCDEYGIYVEDETAICFVGSHRTEAYRATGASESDPEFTERYLSQLKEMVDNHRNHPSVVIWSIGNENKFGSNFVEEYKWMKTTDLTRPVIYSYPGQVPDSLKNYDIISMHYPSWQGNLDQQGISTKGFKSAEMPMLFDEWAHVACYNNFEIKEDPNVRNFWGQSLDSMWTYTFEADGALGGAIWCMLDETFMLPKDLDGYNEWWGILDKNIIPATYMGPTVGYGEWGIIDSWRRKKPEFWGTKKAYSPTKIYTKQINEFQPNSELKVPVHNRFDHTNFSELKIVWSYGEKSGELSNINLEPHKKGELVFPA
ncbi:MAG: beta-galactosidase, partial [Gammaproteobacteria bacterium]|nr:beta-galactosidase [Gammaproteobacteria bacterium]